MKKSKKQLKMIEINLIPEVKQEVLNARQARDRVATWSIIISGGFIALVVVLAMVVMIVQNLIIGSQKSQIEADFKKYKNYPGAASLLTIQNQLNALKDMHAKKYITSRMFTLLTQVIPTNNLNIKTSKIDVDPHGKKIILDAYSEAGYVELERLIKTMSDAKVAFIDIAKIQEIRKKESEGASAEEVIKAWDDLIKNAQYVDLLKERASLLSDATFAENSEGKKVLTFKVGLAMNEEFFLGNDKNLVVQGISYQDVTDSYLSVPQSIFGSLKSDNESKQEKK